MFGLDKFTRKDINRETENKYFKKNYSIKYFF